MKKILVSALALAMAASMFGCSKEGEQKETPDDPETQIEEPVSGTEELIAGGWTDAEDPSITDELKEMFKEAMGQYNGVPPIVPVELISTQVVAGINYKFLGVDAYELGENGVRQYYVTIYKDLQGFATLTDVERLEEPYTGEIPENDYEPLTIAQPLTLGGGLLDINPQGEGDGEAIAIVGGWSDTEDSSITDELKEMFKEAMGQYDGVPPIVPVELLSTQVVAGINYKFLGVDAYEFGENGVRQYYVTIYKNLEGFATLTNVERLEEPYTGEIPENDYEPLSIAKPLTLGEGLLEIVPREGAEGEAIAIVGDSSVEG